MNCPVCKNTHPDWFTTHELRDDITVLVIRIRRAFICKKCGIVFTPVTSEAIQFWEKLRKEEKKNPR
ncbi:MAG: hypothetical protein ACE5F6_00445 [Anaerolineae bacterium]